VVADHPARELVKISARIARHGRYVVSQLAAVAVPRALFAAILRRVGRLRGPPVRRRPEGAREVSAGAEGGSCRGRCWSPAEGPPQRAGGFPSFTRAALALPAGLPIDAPLRGAPSSLETEANRGISVNREALDEMARETYVIWQKICVKEPCSPFAGACGKGGRA
jgi:hypothetical protein